MKIDRVPSQRLTEACGAFTDPTEQPLHPAGEPDSCVRLTPAAAAGLQLTHDLALY